MQVKLAIAPVNAPVPNEPPSEVVAVSPPESSVFVPHAKPRVVAFAPPVAVMLPFKVAVVWVTDEGDCEVTVGRAHADVVNDAEIAPIEVPAEFAAYARE